MNSVSHWIYFSWLNACPLRLVFKTEQLLCGCNYQKSVWHNYIPVTEHIPGMELLGDFFSCLPVELQHGVYISFLHKLTCGNKCQAQQSPQWAPRYLWQAVCGDASSLYPLWHLSILPGEAVGACCVLGLLEVCSLRILFLLEGIPRAVFVPVWGE